MKALILAACAVALGGCGQDIAEFNREPIMSRVGSGLSVAHDAIPHAQATGRPVDVAFNSIYSRNTSESLFRDARAMKVGDVVTVRVSFKDKAKLDNNTDRSRNSATKFGLDLAAAFNGSSGQGSLSADVNSDSSSRGRGQTDRSEEIDVSVAAVVTQILPNGNLLISGSQEMRVNYDMRVLNVAGIVRPGDITGNNTVAYDKIAEARVSYGGRGRAMEVQQPAWGQQLYDRITPF